MKQLKLQFSSSPLLWFAPCVILYWANEDKRSKAKDRSKPIPYRRQFYCFCWQLVLTDLTVKFPIVSYTTASLSLLTENNWLMFSV